MRGSQVGLRRLALMLALALVVGVLGRAGSTAAQGREVVIKVSDYAFEAPDQIEAGITSFVLENAGQELHHAQIARLPDGKTVADLQAALASPNPGAAFALLEFVGGPGVIAPGSRSARVTLNLSVGLHVLICFVPSADGVPHFAKGMLKPLQVVAATGQPASAPTANGTIILKDFAFVLPSNIQAGAQTWNITNEGPQPHEMILFRMAPGKGAADALAAVEGGSGPPPFTTLGGMQGLNSGKSGWLTVDLQPAKYVALCVIPDQATGKPHAELGMIAEFDIAGAGGAMPLPSTGEAPLPVSLPDTGGESGLPVFLMMAALLLLTLGGMLQRRLVA